MITLANRQSAQRVLDHWDRTANRLDEIFHRAAITVAPRLISELRRRIQQGEAVGPPERPRRNRSERPEPWYDTGWLAEHIQIWVEGTTVWVGIPHGVMEEGPQRRQSRGEVEATTVAFNLENGAVIGGRYIPARPVLRPTVLQLHRGLSRLVAEEMVHLMALGAR